MGLKKQYDELTETIPIYTDTTFVRSNAIRELRYTYSRANNPNIDLLETKLGNFFKSQAISYSSGSAAILAALFLFSPTRIWVENTSIDAISVLRWFSKRFYVDVKVLPEPSEFQASVLDPNGKDLVWLEFFSHATGMHSGYIELLNKGQLVGTPVAIEASFSPPPFRYPLEYGSDVVVYSKPDIILGSTNHDSGFIAVSNPESAQKLKFQRTVMGPVLGNLGAWNLIRCLKTYELRCQTLSHNSIEISSWLNENACLSFKGLLKGVVSPGQTNQIAPLYSLPFILIKFLGAKNARRAVTIFNIVSSRGDVGSASKMVFSDKDDTGCCILVLGLEESSTIKANFIETMNFLKEEINQSVQKISKL